MRLYTKPRPIRPDDALATFACGNASLDQWLVRRAIANEARRASRTFVTAPTSSPGAVVGYYTLAAGSVEHAGAPGRLRRNMPDPIPAIVLARLAVDLDHQGRGLGSALLVDAAARAASAAQVIGAKTLLVHAVDADVGAFYERLGFAQALPGPFTCVAAIEDITQTLGPRCR
ncbi:MAG: GNAT family N-acetyltransferase [Bifidobacteriaceae bacterium]|jgi:GNAT superfamily N-acetyltransferase|nr:GNAT family N-acetyltransferase [Bifidobacteriaceae bacterium]